MKKMLTLILLAFSNVSFAEEPEDETPTVIYKEETEIDFEDLEIDGQIVKPDGNLIIDRTESTFNPLIKLRMDFNPEMDQSIDHIK
tara:strand:- start:491 stop:748 length:258 start_codon:yes stop_codon:yes gene_type:complete